MRRNVCFLLAIVAFAATAAGRCPGIPKTHCAALHRDVTCSGWSYKVHEIDSLRGSAAALNPVGDFYLTLRCN